jgi:3-hydroxybutyryl-CoA dehydratase
MMGKPIEQIRPGQTAAFTKTLAESDVYLYAGITGDLNPAHVNEVYARNTFFKTRIAHGMLLVGLISTVLGNLLPGPGTVYVRQETDFLSPARIGDTVTATVEVTHVLKEKNRIRARTFCTNQDGTLLLDGEAVVSPPKVSGHQTVSHGR